MSTDLFGKPLANGPEYTLSVHQKRQAVLLYHWMSSDYLRGLKSLIDSLIQGADVLVDLARLQGRDQILTNDRWGVRDKPANWSTFVYPVLEDFRKTTIQQIAQIAIEIYDITGATDCIRAIGEFSSLWMTAEEEDRFNTQLQLVAQYANKIDRVVGVGAHRRLNDFYMTTEWKVNRDKWRRLPLVRVRTDIEGITGKRPPRTGVYVSQDDPLASLQFGWKGNEDGQLREASTFSSFGLELLGALGRRSLWTDDPRMSSFAVAAKRRDQTLDTGPYDEETIRAHPECSSQAMSFASFRTRPCKWYFVELINGEYDDEDPDAAATNGATTGDRLRCEANHPCPKSGFWSTPAQVGTRRFFQLGEVMPRIESDYGATIWQWEQNQDSPRF